jgi:hypothetical protein
VIPVGPFVTLGIWIVIIGLMLRHDAGAADRPASPPWFELVPIAVAIVMIQLLLDLHRRWLGDLAALAVHVIGAAILWLRRRGR